MNNGSLFADIGFSSSRTILAEVASFYALGSGSSSKAGALLHPPLFLANDNVPWSCEGCASLAWNSL